jgi:hypothetical protein
MISIALVKLCFPMFPGGIRREPFVVSCLWIDGAYGEGTYSVPSLFSEAWRPAAHAALLAPLLRFGNRFRNG